GVKLPAGGASGFGVGDYNGDGFLDLYVTSYTLGPWGILFRSNGDLTFRDVTEQAGMDNGGMEMTILWLDYDNDGDLDSYHVNDIRGPNKLYRNNGNGTFTDLSAAAGVDDAGSGMGAGAGDLNNDGFLDLFITNFVYDSPLLASGDGTFQNMAGNFLIRETLLEQITILDEDTDVNWAAVMFDADNDGDLDIFSSSGSVMGPTVYPNYFWLNEGDNNFRNISKELGLEDFEGTARGAAVCDYDQDGDLDLYVVNINEAPNRLYRNDTPRKYNWLDVKLQGLVSNRDAIGARVYLYAGDMFQMRDLVCGNNYQSDNYRQVHFGLNSKTKVDSLVVRWPSGYRNVRTDITTNQVVTLVEEENDQGPTPQVSLLAQNQPNPFVMTGTTIRFELSRPGKVSLKIYNILGQEVRTLVDEFKPVGKHTVRWDATDNDRRKLASGLYFYRILSGDYSATRRMVFIR
ncbi:FG-GAP-like repeat-containing protein, partial [candidate division KSB1 bacterium]